MSRNLSIRGRIAVFMRVVPALAMFLGVIPTSAGGAAAQDSDPVLTTYTSPSYGFTVTYDERIWYARTSTAVYGHSGELTFNDLYLIGEGDNTHLYFRGKPEYGGDATTCAESNVGPTAEQWVGEGPRVSATTPNGGVVRTIFAPATGKNAYIECHTIVAGISVVEVWCFAEAGNKCFDDQTLPAAQVVIATLTIPVTEKRSSTTYGYGFDYLPEIWTPYQEQKPTEQYSAEEIRFHRAGRGESTMLNVTALPMYGGDAATCLSEESTKSFSSSSITNVKPKLNDKGAEVRGTSAAGGEFAAYTFELNGVASIGYMECRTIEAGASVLRISLVANADTYDEDFADAWMVFGTITIDQG